MFRRLLCDSPEELLTASWLCADVMAFGAICELEDCDVRVPQDVSVVSWGGTQFARWSDATVTTVSFDYGGVAELG